MALTPATFRGEEIARVRYGVDGPEPTGTQVRFDAQHVKAWFIEQAVRYFDMEVYLDGQPTPQEPFLKDPDHVADWNGVRIGLYKGPPRVECPSELSFHGTVSRLSIPTGAGRAYARAEIDQCPASLAARGARPDDNQGERLQPGPDPRHRRPTGETFPRTSGHSGDKTHCPQELTAPHRG